MTDLNLQRFKQEEFTPRNDWLERLARFNDQFGRFLRDPAGVSFIAFAFMAFLALWNWTDGVVLTPIAGILRIWFGWGSILILTGIAYLGFSLLQRERTHIHWGRILALELAALLTLGLLAVFSGNDLFRASLAWTAGASAGDSSVCYGR